MDAIIDAIKWLAKPVVQFFISISTLVSLLIGAVLDPNGAVNQFICGIIDMISSLFPSTPDALKIGSILSSFANTYPIIGWGILLEIIQTCSLMLTIVALIKLYKLIPFKMT